MLKPFAHVHKVLIWFCRHSKKYSSGYPIPLRTIKESITSGWEMDESFYEIEILEYNTKCSHKSFSW
jgi:hypothetical protein